jgi:hypothetical protein
MLPRHTLLVLPALVLACSSSSDDQTHGPVVDAAPDTVMDNPPDGAPDTGHVETGGGDSGHKDGAAGREGGADAGGDGPAADSGGEDGGDAKMGSCKGTIALAGGTSSVAFGAASVNGAAWNVSSLTTTSSPSNPTLVPFSGGFMAMFTAATIDTLQYSYYSTAAWSPGANADNSSCSGPPEAYGTAALAPIGTTLHSVYLGTDNDFFHGTYKSGSWDCGDDPLTPSGGTQSFGPSAPAAATVGTTLVVVYDGNDGNLYAQSWSGGAWASAAAITGASVTSSSTPPTLIALTGGSSDLMVVYEDVGDNKLYSSTRTGGSWSAPALTNMNAYTLEPVSLAPLAAGGAVAAFEGTDGNGYAMTYDPSGSTWTTPAALLATGEPLPSPPTVATGVCGADAIAALVQPGGVQLVTLASGAWSTGTLVSGAASMDSATIATSP